MCQSITDCLSKFQSTLPRRERPRGSSTATTATCFNPRPRAGSDRDAPQAPCGRGVSIHAPARGATPVQTVTITQRTFQSTPPRGERQPFAGTVTAVVVFQSTPPRGERHGQVGHVFTMEVSIHAPARGATRMTVVLVRTFRVFQSTPPRGERRHRL